MSSIALPLDLNVFFNPRSVAIIGLTEKSAWARHILKNFQDIGFDGRLYGVNNSGADTFGVPCYRSIKSIPEPVDLGFVMVPSAAVNDAIRDAAACGVRSFVMLTSGFAETGPQGAKLQLELLDTANALGIKVWGPNSLGFNNVSARIPVSAIGVPKPVLTPSISLVTQSGSNASQFNAFAHSQGIGTAIVAATGNEMQIGIADVVDYLVDHEPTRAIAVFAETIRDPAKFAASAMRARDKRKPIVLLAVGRNELSAKVAMAHTGSLIGSDTILNAVCERLGIIRVYSAEDLINVAGLLAATGPIAGQRLSFVSNSGGSCTLVADGAQLSGATLARIEPGIASKLRGLLPDGASDINPLDVTGAAVRDPELLGRVLQVVASGADSGLVAVGINVPTSADQTEPPGLAAIGRAAKHIDKPLMIVTTCAKELSEHSRELVRKYDLPHIMTGIDGMLRAVGKAFWWSRQIHKTAKNFRPSEDTCSPAEKIDTEREALAFLERQGVPVVPGPVAADAREARSIAATLGTRVALKVSSPDIAHKTEVGGVRLDVKLEDVEPACNDMLRHVRRSKPDARIDGVIVSPMRDRVLISAEN
jgi:acyl-CoA synthetase (NDP forming)